MGKYKDWSKYRGIKRSSKSGNCRDCDYKDFSRTSEGCRGCIGNSINNNKKLKETEVNEMGLVLNPERNKKVFLGGTCNGSNWRDELIPLLKLKYFNPVVEDWSEECYAEELRQREECDFCLYVITPKMTGVYSIAEVVDDSNKRPEKTIFCFIEEDEEEFTDEQIKSLTKVGVMVKSNGGMYIPWSLRRVANILNKQ